MEDNKNEILDEGKDETSEDEKEESKAGEEAEKTAKGKKKKNRKKKKNKKDPESVSTAIKLLANIRRKGYSLFYQQRSEDIIAGIINYIKNQVDGNVSNEIVKAYKEGKANKLQQKEDFEKMIIAKVKQKFNFVDQDNILAKLNGGKEEIEHKAYLMNQECNKSLKELAERSSNMDKKTAEQEESEIYKKHIVATILAELIIRNQSKEQERSFRKDMYLKVHNDQQKDNFSVGNIISFPCEEKGGTKKVGIVVNVDLKDGRNDVFCLNSESAKDGKLRLDLALDNEELLLSEIKDEDGKVLFKSAFDNDKKISYLSRDTYRNSNDEVKKAEFLAYLPKKYAENIIKELETKKAKYDKEWYNEKWQLPYDKVISNLKSLTEPLGKNK